MDDGLAVTRRISRRAVLRLLAAGAFGAIAAPACEDDGDDGADDGDDGRTPAPTASATDLGSRRIVRQIDHILLRTDNAQALFDLLTVDLGLPVAWPLFTYRGFSSGAVGFGNVNLEVLQHVEGEAPPFARAPGTYPVGLALEPITADGAVRELDARKIAHSQPFEDGISDAIRWTNIDLTGPPECPILLFVKYAFDQDARRGFLGAQLRERNGGPLGVEALRAVEIGVRDAAAAIERWRRLIDPVRGGPTWSLGDGPELRLIENERDRFLRVVLTVRSLEDAAAALQSRAALGERTRDYVTLDPGDGSAAIRLVAVG